ncbi:tRNA uridine-5-carboxymethylaminomethyl(34) synthesis GTPase MnmE [Methylopila sp. M107]|uniref:tRNA uridine-5-carboxymethylaminomethyl(34) synthesis GTPase MnmE n=1 Tax=Methylopila sp. M107 TaxID=1101190 RepID=UPI0003620011|nr:tRNA uridine-5-carboxymethylaminomethyl(34) synthesis GTPase MnmE [Methylopila sp. M107]
MTGRILASGFNAFDPRDTIAAISTAPGRAAIAVLRVSGSSAADALMAIAGSLPNPRRAAFRAFKNPRDGALIDRGIALWFPGPKTVTGEDVAEFHVHGGRAVVAAILDAALGVPGVRMAEAGEFTRRAFVAGRMDLAEAEGLADLLAAETEVQRKQALIQSEGGLSALIEGWRGRLVGAMALVEAGIDFSDEDGVPAQVRSEAKREVEGLARDIEAALADRRAERLRSGFQVAILGRPNAGKSSLLNALARRDVAIVTDAAGTTRDVLEVHLDLDGVPVTIADTAGLREAVDPAEREGVRRAEARAAVADLVLWLEDARAPDPAGHVARHMAGRPDGPTIWRVASKADLGGPAWPAGHSVSAITGHGLDGLVAALAEAGRAAIGGGETAGFSRARHRDAAASVAALLGEALGDWDALPDELLAETLRAAATELGRITGRIGVEDVLGEVFSSFCIGK